MTAPVFSDPRFYNEEAAFEYVESHLWPSGPVCPHCAATAEKIGHLQNVRSKASAKNPEGVVQIGLRKCYACRGPAFTVRKGTIFEDSHLALHKWLQAVHLLCASKKGISTRQLQRMLGCGLKTAWHLGHRIRLAMDPGSSTPIGGLGHIVEADETALTNSQKTKRKDAGRKKPHAVVLSLVDRSGPIRSVVLDHRGVRPHVWELLHKDSKLMTDSAQHFKNMLPVGQHEAVDHSKFEWKRGDAHTNTLEGFFSIFKRGMIGTYQHVEKQHLFRYLAEFDFRQNYRVKLGYNDVDRAEVALRGVKGKRLTYETTATA